METEDTENLVKSDIGVDGKDNKDILFTVKFESLFVQVFNSLEANGLSKKESLRELKKDLHIVEQMSKRKNKI